MKELYRIGISIGIIFLYSLATLGVGYFISYVSDDNEPVLPVWGIGLVLFFALALFTLTKFGMW